MSKETIIKEEIKLDANQLNVAIKEYLVKHHNFMPTHVGLDADHLGRITGARGITDGRAGYGYGVARERVKS